MEKLTKEEIAAYQKFSELCKKLEAFPIKKAKVINIKTKKEKK